MNSFHLIFWINEKRIVSDLLMHVVEQFTSTIFIDDLSVGRFERIYQMPMPMMQIDTDIFTEVPQAKYRRETCIKLIFTEMTIDL